MLENIACDTCNTTTTINRESVMDTFACDRIKTACLNCCGCEDHEGELWYAPLTIHRHYSFRRNKDDDLEIYLSLHDLAENAPREETDKTAWQYLAAEVVDVNRWYLADVEEDACN